MGANRQYLTPDDFMPWRRRAYYDEDGKRCELPEYGPEYRVVREFTKPYPKIVRDGAGKPVIRA